MTKRQPNSSHCFVCGVSNPFGLHLKFYNVSPGEIASDTVVPEQYQGYPGVVHGGIVASMLDELAGRAHMAGAEPHFMYTARLNVKYRKNVPVGRPIHLVGKAGSSSSRAHNATSAIYDEYGVLLAEADALLIDVPAGKLDGVDLSQLGWRVYSDEELAQLGIS